MRVKVGDTWYDGADVPVMVELTKMDKFNIAHMAEDNTKYAMFPSEYDVAEIRAWMEHPNDKQTEG